MTHMSLGKVYLVGAGPGRAGLITVRGLEVLRRADAVLHDALVNPVLLTMVRPDAQLIPVGKRRGGRHCDQGEINQRMVGLAREGKTVCRLKGGDPFVFGRGAEEAQALTANGIPYEVVPGVTSGIGGLTYAGIPFTHRKINQAVCLVTGHDNPDDPESRLDWSALARLGNLVFFMGAHHLEKLACKLIAAGLPADTPAAVIEHATWPTQRVWTGTAETLASRVAAEPLATPALVVFGGIVNLRNQLNWFERLPLFGSRVVVTQAETPNRELSAGLTELGAEVLEAPMIEFAPPADWSQVDAHLRSLSTFDWVVWTSAQGVQASLARLRTLGLDGRHLAGCRLAVIGPTTQAALERQFLRADLCPEVSSGSALGEALARNGGAAGKSFLLLRSDIALPGLPDVLRAGGTRRVEEVSVYQTCPVSSCPEAVRTAFARRQIHWVTFTSPSAVQNFTRLLSTSEGQPTPGRQTLAPMSGQFRVASIGPSTSAAVRECGLTVNAEAVPHTVAGLVEAIRQASASTGKS